MSKYRNKWTRCLHGHHHQSKAEAGRCDELMMLFRAGQIHNLETQPRFPLHVGKKRLGHYVADFVYFDDNGRRIVEDVKGGPILPISKWKIAHAEAEYNFDVQIVRMGRRK